MNLGTSLHWVSKKMKDKICLVEDGVEVSYSELWRKIKLLAKAFLKIGIKENDKIVIFLPNCKEFIFSFYALSRINAIGVPLNPQLTSFELTKIFADCMPQGIITSSLLYSKKMVSYFKVKYIFIIDGNFKKGQKDVHGFEELYSIGENSSLSDFNTSNEQIATINYTYRGTGEPLGAVLTHGNYHHGAIGYVRLTELVTSQRVLLVTPISHIFTLVSCVIVPLLRGATVVIMKSFIPSHVFRIIEEQKIDFIIAVPTVYISLLRNYDKNKYNIGTLKYGITGGSYLPFELYKEIKRKMDIELLQGYGLTETMPITCNPRLKNKPASLGVPGHEVKIRIINKNGKDAGLGEKGEIVVGGPTVMRGYYNKDGENKAYFKNGWFWTGDYGWIDEDGYVYFEGMKKDIVKIGGNNVDMNEVKAVLASYPGVKSVELDIVWDYLWGNLLNARLKVTHRKKIDEKKLRSFCVNRLAVYKLPKRIFVIHTKG
jgi:long-chain acyl-CoA synthetase